MNELTWSNLRKHWADSAAKEPKFGSDSELELMRTCGPINKALHDLGWDSAVYCPKDGSLFMGWEFPWGAPLLCSYSGEWPNGSFWQYSAGDAWPCSLNLWRKITPEEREIMEKYKQTEAGR